MRSDVWNSSTPTIGESPAALTPGCLAYYRVVNKRPCLQVGDNATQLSLHLCVCSLVNVSLHSHRNCTHHSSGFNTWHSEPKKSHVISCYSLIENFLIVVVVFKIG